VQTVVARGAGRRPRRAPALVTLTVAVVITGGCAPTSTTVSGRAVSASPTETPGAGLPRPVTAVAGTAPHRDGALEFVVLDIARASFVGDPAKPGLSMNARGVFLVVTLSIRNRGDAAVTLFDRDQTLIDTNGTTFAPNMAADIYSNPTVHSTRMSPGDSLVVHIVFDVPPETVPAKLLLRESSSSRGVEVALR
jgi:hypothetical protein